MMKTRQSRGVSYLSFESFEKYPSLIHAFSTRIGGVSKNEFTSMNLSFSSDDERKNILTNFNLFCDAINIDINSLVTGDQTHTANVMVVKKDDIGKGIMRKKTYSDVDGLVTNVPGITLVTFYADCVPLYFFDPVKLVVASSHAGWRGTVSKIAEKTIKKMIDEFGSDPKNILAGIGPSIGKECFEVSKKEADYFLKMDKNIIQGNVSKQFNKENKYLIDLQNINKNLMIQNGLLPSNIEIANICTKCNSDWLFSHRATNGKRGGMAAVIGIKAQ